MGKETPERIWHSSPELQTILKVFHYRKANYSVSTKYLVRYYKEKFSVIHEYLKNKGIATDFHFTGSTVEGLKVPTSCMELDVMVVLSGSEKVHCSVDDNCPLFAAIYKAGYGIVQPARTVERLFGAIQDALNNNKDIGEVVTLRKHGPAVQMDVYKDTNKSVLFYQVDMVPTYRIPCNTCDYDYYVPKSHKAERTASSSGQEAIESRQVNLSQYDFKTWRRSFSPLENVLIAGLGGCRKDCMRILKALRDSEAGLKGLSSYIIKTAMLWFDEESTNDWKTGNLGKCFMDFLSYLQKTLEEGDLQHFFMDSVHCDDDLPNDNIPSFNLLQEFSNSHQHNMAERLKELLRSEKKFYELLLKHVKLYDTFEDNITGVVFESAKIDMPSVQEPAGFFRWLEEEESPIKNQVRDFPRYNPRNPRMDQEAFTMDIFIAILCIIIALIAVCFYKNADA